jgi:hypothetical protein
MKTPMPPERTQRRERALRAVLGASSVLATLLAAEVVVRAAHLAPSPQHRLTARLVDARWRELLDCYPTNPRGYFDIDLRNAAARERFHHLVPLRYDALARRVPYAVAFRYNRLRFRDQEAAPKSAHSRRVVVVGDSFTEGQGVKEADTMPRRLESLLNAQAILSWDVRNCGRRATDFPALMDNFEAAQALEPDVVVYAMVLNDAIRAPEFEARQTYVNDWILDHGQRPDAPLPPPLRFYQSHLLTFLRGRLEGHRVGLETTRWYLEMYGLPNSAGWGETRTLIREMRRRTLARGARFVLVLWPLLVDTDARYPFTPVHEEIRRFSLSAGIEELDLLPVLRGRPTRDLWVHPVDKHPNELAQGLAADALARMLGAQAPVRP